MVGEQLVVLSIKVPLRLLLKHLEAKGLAGLGLAPEVHVSASLAVEGLARLPLRHLLEHDLLIATRRLAYVPLCLVVAQSLQLLLIPDLKVLQLEEVLGATLLILLKFARLSLDEHLVLLSSPIELLLLVQFLLLQDTSVLFLVVHLHLTLHLLELSLLLDLIHIALSSDLTVLFFLLLVHLAHSLFLIDALLGLLAHTLDNILPLLLFSLAALGLLPGLYLQHIVLLVSILLAPRLQLLLSHGALVVQIHLEGVLQLPLLNRLVRQNFLLHLVLVPEHGSPLIKHLLLLLDWQVASLVGLVGRVEDIFGADLIISVGGCEVQALVQAILSLLTVVDAMRVAVCGWVGQTDIFSEVSGRLWVFWLLHRVHETALPRTKYIVIAIVCTCYAIASRTLKPRARQVWH